MSLSELAQTFAALEDAAQKRPLDFFRWLPGQREFLEATGPRVLLRGGNQWLGKTTVGVAELWYRLTGDHPLKPVRKPPITALVITATHEQGQNIQRRIFDLADASMLTDDTVWDPAKGAFRGKYPRVRLKNGSECMFRSGRGEALNLAGLTVDYVWIDEPPTSSRVYSEALKRLLRTSGDMRLTLTPINAPVEWLRQACEAGQIQDIHCPLTPEAVIPVGATRPIRLGDGTPADQEWIDALRAETLAHEIPVVIDGEWETRSLAPIFAAWQPSAMVSRKTPRGDVPVFVGIDHGEGKHGSSCGLVVAVEAVPGEDAPHVYVLSEYASPDLCTEDQDAAGILEALERAGLLWCDLKMAYGDRPHHGSNRRGSIAKKSNALLTAALCRATAAPHHGIARGHNLTPPIRSAKRGKGGPGAPGAVSFGCTWLHRAMLRGRFTVHPRCVNLIGALSRYQGRPNSQASHYVDALRYSLREVIYGSVKHTRSASRVAFR